MSLKLGPLATDWGQQLHAVALARGLNSQLHLPTQRPSPGRTIFCRPQQKAPNAGRLWALRHIAEGGQSVQSTADLNLYEDRIQQMLVLQDFYPTGHVITAMEHAKRVAATASYPLVSKAPYGSSSRTVRLLANESEALAEARIILQGKGVQFAGWPPQTGVCLWQEFMPRNSYSLRVAKITKAYGWAFKVMNRTNDWRASGSGMCVPLTADDWANPRFQYAINTALLASDTMQSRWCGFDLLYSQHREDWRIVDTTLAWTNKPALLGGNYDAPVYNLHTFEPHPKGLKGGSQWDILLDSLLEAA
jgi:hypothetical protein